MVSWVIFSVSYTSADPVNVQSDRDRNFEYAEHLFNNKDYPAAAEAYKRFIFFFPDDERGVKAEYRIGLSYFNSNHFEKALDYFVNVRKKHASGEIGFNSGLMISRIYERLNDSHAAKTALLSLLPGIEDTNRRDNIYYRLGWLFVQTGEMDQARKFFEDISRPNQQAFEIKSVTDQLDQFRHIPQKKPLIAGLLSIFPGGGYLYCGRYQDAFISFLINGALIYGACESFDEDLYALGGIISAVELGFYTGNIYGGISSAHKYNEAKKAQFIRLIEKEFQRDQYLTISCDMHSKKIFIGATVRF